MVKGKGYEELWTPGGKIKINETDKECLERELKEEIGATLNQTKFFKEYSSISPYAKDTTTIQRVFIASISGKLVPDAEIEKIIWMAKNDFLEKKYRLLPTTEKEIIPDLIKEKILNW